MAVMMLAISFAAAIQTSAAVIIPTASLIVNYTFDGTTAAEVGKDHAGTTEETLNINLKNAGSSLAGNSTLYIARKAGAASEDDVKTGSIPLDSGDFATITDKATLFIAVKPDFTDYAGGWCNLFYVEGMIRVFIGETDHNIHVRFLNTTSTYNFSATTQDTGFDLVDGQINYLAFVFNKKDDANFNVTMYFSSNGTTYETAVSKDLPIANNTFFQNTTTSIQLPDVAANRMSLEYHDFRVYNIALNADQVKNIYTAKGSEEQSSSDNGSESGDTAPDTADGIVTIALSFALCCTGAIAVAVVSKKKAKR